MVSAESFESSMKYDAVICVLIFSAILLLPADEPFKHPPKIYKCVLMNFPTPNQYALESVVLSYMLTDILITMATI